MNKSLMSNISTNSLYCLQCKKYFSQVGCQYYATREGGPQKFQCEPCRASGFHTCYKCGGNAIRPKMTDEQKKSIDELIDAYKAATVNDPRPTDNTPHVRDSMDAIILSPDSPLFEEVRKHFTTKRDFQLAHTYLCRYNGPRFRPSDIPNHVRLDLSIYFYDRFEELPRYTDQMSE